MCRVWVLVTFASPLRVYLFDGGVVPFGAVSGSGNPNGPDLGGAQPAANAGADLIVNLWRLDRSQARAALRLSSCFHNPQLYPIMTCRRQLCVKTLILESQPGMHASWGEVC